MKINGRIIKLCVVFLTDVVLTGALLCVLALFHHVIPSDVQLDQSLNNTNQTPLPTISFGTPAPTIIPGTTDDPLVPTATPDITMGGIFTTGEVVVTENQYKSANVSIKCTTYTTSRLVYHVQDIYIKSMDCFKTAFANDHYAKGSNSAKFLTLANSKNAIAAINGDQYGARQSGVVIRNGYLYRDIPFDDVCVLYVDGTMKIFRENEFDGKQEMENGALHGWCFGPAMVINQEAVTEFESGIAGPNPRTAIGYYAPGHYCFVTVDGRSSISAGIKFVDFAILLRDLGCVMAYNLDGGRTSQMSFMGEIYNNPYENGRSVNDIIYICDI